MIYEFPHLAKNLIEGVHLAVVVVFVCFIRLQKIEGDRVSLLLCFGETLLNGRQQQVVIEVFLCLVVQYICTDLLVFFFFWFFMYNSGKQMYVLKGIF